MMRKKHLETIKVDTDRVKLAKYFNIDEADVIPYPVPKTYQLLISNNEEAQKIYKVMTHGFGNTSIPKHYDFDKELLVIWNDRDKPQAV